jgi:hypothetical protein
MENVIVAFSSGTPPLPELALALDGLAPELQLQPERIVLVRGEDDDETLVFIEPYRQRAFLFAHWPQEMIPADRMVLDVRYRDVGFVKEVVLALARRYTFVISANLEVMSSAEFVRRCTVDPEWDWLAEGSARILSALRRGRLDDLLHLRRPVAAVLFALADLGWGGDGDAAVLRRDHAASVLHRYVAGELGAQEVAAWATALRGRADVGFEPGAEEALKRLLAELADPMLTQPIATESARAWVDKLRSPDDPGAQPA